MPLENIYIFHCSSYQSFTTLWSIIDLGLNSGFGVEEPNGYYYIHYGSMNIDPYLFIHFS